MELFKDAIDMKCRPAIENIGDLYMETGAIDSAISYFEKLPGKLSCQIKLAKIYDDREDIEGSITWYKKAAENGDIPSAYRLACIYEDLGNIKGSIKYFEQAAAANHLNAMVHLGRIYYYEGMYDESKNRFRVPAQEGNTYCQHMMGVISDISDENIEEATRWYEKAKLNNCIESVENLGRLYYKRNDFNRAEEYYKEGVERGSRKCAYMLGCLYYKKSNLIFEKLAKKEFENAPEILGDMKGIDIAVSDVQLPAFELCPVEVVEEPEYVPGYIINIKEDLEGMLEGFRDDMVFDDEN